jgi:hypothetical protein
MAYKFQRGAATLSGSLIQEGDIEATGKISTLVSNIESGGNLSGSSDLLIGGTVRLDGVAAAVAAVASDSFYFLDADNLMKKESMADYAALIAGDALAASSGVLAVAVDDTGIEIDSDALRLKDNGVTLAKMAGIARGSVIVGDASGDPSLLAKGTAHQFLQSDGTDVAYVSLSGDATLNAGAITIADNAVTLAKMAGLARGRIILGDSSGDPSALALGSNAQILISDGNDLAYASVSGDLTITNAGVTAIGATKVTDAMLNDDVATGLAGVGLGATSGVLAVQVSGAVHITSDKVAITGSIAGKGLAFSGGVNSISDLSVDLSEMGTGAVADGDSFVFIDANDSNKTKQESVADLAVLFAGNGLSANASALALDLNELSAAAVDVAADSIAIVDANDSNGSRKESIADLATAMAGAGITATNGVFSVAASNAVNGIGDANATLAEGYNYGNAQLTADRTWTLPASAGMSVGDKVVVKAPADINGRKIIISRAGSQTIDGYTAGIELETSNAALTLIYAAADTWIIV